MHEHFVIVDRHNALHTTRTKASRTHMRSALMHFAGSITRDALNDDRDDAPWLLTPTG